MRLQLRFVVLLVFIFSGVAGLVYIGHQQNVDRTKDLLDVESSQHLQHFESILSLDSSRLKSFAADYSFWDQMSSFVITGDGTFASQTIDPSLSTFDADALWVYTKDNILKYYTHSSRLSRDATLNWTKQLSAKLDKQDTLHFYQQTSAGMLEVQAATIVGSDDPRHEGQTNGYLAVARLIDDAYTAQLSQLTQSLVTLNAASSVGAKTADTDSISVAKLLPGYDGRSVGELRSGYKSTAVASLDRSYSQQLRLLLILTVALIVISALYIWREVLVPIGTISKSIKMQRPSLLDPVVGLKTEFGPLAGTVKEFFAQKLTISKSEFERATLEKMNKDKISFMAVAAHELNNPINAVRLFAEYLTTLQKTNGPKEKIDLMVDRINKQINKANMLINDLHSAAEGESKDVALSMKEVDFDEFLEEELEQARLVVRHKLLHTGTTGQKVVTDSVRLGQVVVNLLRNAYKTSPDADTIHITSKFENGQVVVGVQDFGLGITKADQKHIFDRFYAPAGEPDLSPGLGLGLSISKQLIERLGGKMWVESAQGLGSTFYFSLPAAGDSKRPPSAPLN